MILDWLPADEAALTPALVTGDRQLSWAEFRRHIQRQSNALSDFVDRRVGLALAAEVESLSLLFGLASLGVHTFLMPADTSEPTLATWSRDFGLAAIFRDDGTTLAGEAHAQEAVAGAVTILTSGTTGRPKAAQHSWRSLTRPVRRVRDGTHPRWLLTYRPHLYAGLQVMMQCMLNQGTLVLPGPGDSAEQVATLAADARVEFASATPSYWRWLLAMAGSRLLAKIPLKQITLGGEAVDQATLDALHRTFPNTRLVHIYATTELGRCFSVTDGLAGFPARFLEEASRDGVEMRVEDGELVVRSANAMMTYEQARGSPREDWFPTGDLVKTEGDRVYFVGRKTDMINVGGNKVYPLEIEDIIRGVPGVADTRVYGEASSVVGELVKCDVVVERGYDASEVEAAIRRRTLAVLNSFQRPRLIAIVDDIARTAAGKTDRG